MIYINLYKKNLKNRKSKNIKYDTCKMNLKMSLNDPQEGTI